jgi:3',5'-cyclic AMP phosphodiesterase CpdA
MRTIVHLSDLHFGRADPPIVKELLTTIPRIQPDLVVVSGDLTQRARVAEFIEARSFLNALPQPQIVVPGNHDIPLYNPFDRFIGRLQRYRQYISEDLEPYYSDAELIVASVNTARSFTFKDGRINAQQLERLRERFQSASAGTIKIVVAHHPIDLPADIGKDLVGRARLALETLSRCGVDLVLSGHLHLTRSCGPTERLRIGGHAALLVQAGTAVSTRARGEPNSFNVIRTTPNSIAVEGHGWSAVRNAFDKRGEERFERGATGWLRTTLECSVPGSA